MPGRRSVEERIARAADKIETAINELDQVQREPDARLGNLRGRLEWASQRLAELVRDWPWPDR
jgi:hypothetical protein